MKVAIRVDASREIGHGHVVRCLALADALSREGAEVVFMCQQLPGDAVEQIREAGFLCWLLSPVSSVEEDADQTASLLDHAPGWNWLVVDHYRLSVRWSRVLRARVGHILAIDDLANRLIDCDVLLDQNLHRDPTRRYAGLVAPTSLQLLGPDYALLRPEFQRAREALQPRDGQLQRMLVCFGGSDVLNATQIALLALLPAFPRLSFDVVVGAAYPHEVSLRQICATHANVQITVAAEDMVSRMVEADLFVGAGGSMTWERAAVGLPGITISIAENQRSLCRLLHDRSENMDLGPLEAFDPAALCEAVRHLASDAGAVREMGKALSRHCDGRGSMRVAAVLCAQP